LYLILDTDASHATTTAGNKRFRDAVSSSLETYMQAETRFEKASVVHKIVDDIRKEGGQFLKKNLSTGRWVQLNEQQAKEKVGHAIRDAVNAYENKLNKVKLKEHAQKQFRSSNSPASLSVSLPSSYARMTTQDTAATSADLHGSSSSGLGLSASSGLSHLSESFSMLPSHPYQTASSASDSYAQRQQQQQQRHGRDPLHMQQTNVSPFQQQQRPSPPPPPLGSLSPQEQQQHLQQQYGEVEGGLPSLHAAAAAISRSQQPQHRQSLPMLGGLGGHGTYSRSLSNTTPFGASSVAAAATQLHHEHELLHLQQQQLQLQQQQYAHQYPSSQYHHYHPHLSESYAAATFDRTAAAAAHAGGTGPYPQHHPSAMDPILLGRAASAPASARESPLTLQQQQQQRASTIDSILLLGKQQLQLEEEMATSSTTAQMRQAAAHVVRGQPHATAAVAASGEAQQAQPMSELSGHDDHFLARIDSVLGPLPSDAEDPMAPYLDQNEREELLQLRRQQLEQQQDRERERQEREHGPE